MVTNECGQCGKAVNHDQRARYYFEDDSWLCCDCFANVNHEDTSMQIDAADDEQCLHEIGPGQ